MFGKLSSAKIVVCFFLLYPIFSDSKQKVTVKKLGARQDVVVLLPWSGTNLFVRVIVAALSRLQVNTVYNESVFL
jgi:hypothetical protein